MAGYDWDYWRHKYVSGDDSVTLEFLSKLPNAPVIGTLKNRASRESWAEQRKQFRYQSMTKVTEAATSQDAIAKVEQLIDAAEIIARHLRLARMFQEKIVERLQTLDPSTLKPADLASWLKVTTDLERLANGLATERQDVTSSDRSMTPTKIIRVVVDPKTQAESEY